MKKRDSDARTYIAMILVVAYILLLAANIAMPLVVLKFFRSPDEATLAAIKDLVAPVTAAVTSLTGVLGFVLGYYFKAEESKRT